MHVWKIADRTYRYSLIFVNFTFASSGSMRDQKSGSLGYEMGTSKKRAYKMIIRERWKYDDLHSIEDDVPYLALLSMAALSLSGMLSLGETSNLMVCRQDQVSHVQICTITVLYLQQKTR